MLFDSSKNLATFQIFYLHAIPGTGVILQQRFQAMSIPYNFRSFHRSLSQSDLYMIKSWFQCFTSKSSNNDYFFSAFAASFCQETFQKSFRTVSKLTKKSLWPSCFQAVEKPTKKLSIFLFNFKESAQTFLSRSSFWPLSSNFLGHKRKDPCVWVSAFSSSQVEISCCRFSGFLWRKNITNQTWVF